MALNIALLYCLLELSLQCGQEEASGHLASVVAGAGEQTDKDG